METAAIARSLAIVGLGLTLLALTGVTTAQSETDKTHTGVILAIKLDERLVTVNGAEPTLTFYVAADALILVKDKVKGDLSDLKVSDTVEIKYTREPAGFTAHKIAIAGLK
jgi:hypothetical protein